MENVCSCENASQRFLGALAIAVTFFNCGHMLHEDDEHVWERVLVGLSCLGFQIDDLNRLLHTAFDSVSSG